MEIHLLKFLLLIQLVLGGKVQEDEPTFPLQLSLSTIPDLTIDAGESVWKPLADFFQRPESGSSLYFDLGVFLFAFFPPRMLNCSTENLTKGSNIRIDRYAWLLLLTLMQSVYTIRYSGVVYGRTDSSTSVLSFCRI